MSKDSAYDYVVNKVMERAQRIAWHELSPETHESIINMAIEQINASNDTWPMSKRALQKYIEQLKKEWV